MADIRGEGIRSLSWRSSEELGVRSEELEIKVSPAAMNFSLFFTLEGQGDWVALLFLWVQKRLTSFSPVSRFYIEVCVF